MIGDILAATLLHQQQWSTVFKKNFLLATTLFAALACTTAKPPEAAKAPDTAADVAKLKSLEEQWYSFYHNGDADSVASLYADDGQVLAAGAPAVVGKAAIHAFFVGDIASTKASGLTDNGGDYNGSGVSGDLGWVSGAYTMNNAAGAVVEHGKYTTLFQRINGDWKIIRDTWNADTPAAPAASSTPPKP
jgi:ketosteroid isomerase-like protein